MTIEVRRAADRFRTEDEGRTTWHSFSFGRHYDPGNVGFGALVAHNDEHLPVGTGYADHPHADMEIVTVVLEGALRHSDAAGRTGVLVPGEISRTSAGSGIVHAEVAEPGLAPGVTTRFVQTWLRPDESGGVPAYDAADVGPFDGPFDGPVEGLIEVVGPSGALGVGTTGARLHLGHLDPGRITLPDAPLLHVFVADAVVTLGDRELVPGDAARLTDEGARELLVERPGRLLVWSLTR